MLPNLNIQDDLEEDMLEDFAIETPPSLTYAMLKKEDLFMGTCNHLEAIKQAVYKIINTERYEYGIYSWDYGIELKDLFGKDFGYVMAEIKYRIMEALTQDDRIDSVENFIFKKLDKHSLHVKFTVVSIEGEFDEEMEVSI